MPPRFLWSAVLSGHMPSMKNGRKAVPAKTEAGKSYVRFIKSDSVLGWMETAAHEMMASMPAGGSIACDVLLFARIYYRSRRSDLSVETLMDALQKGGVILNDRQIRRVIAEAFVDTANPRVEVSLAAITEMPAEDEGAEMAPVQPRRDRIGRAA